MKKEIFISEKRPHESAIKHVSGKAFFTDDIPEPPGTLYGAIGWSKKARAIIKKINLEEVIKSEGVVAVVTADDIPGRNDVGPVYEHQFLRLRQQQLSLQEKQRSRLRLFINPLSQLLLFKKH